ncbi:hypothetical protein [Geminicoccus flavidas]|uniref:hypothetical protein n=1 Tax=Geminicoccus flavidas TaxID=2506407 RepID=UPI001359B86E|nr:hypothetical protein [Geminicoccus flavidas]
MRKALAAAALLLGLVAGPAQAGALVEGVLRGVPIRLETGTDPVMVRVRLGQAELLVDLGRDLLVPLEPAALPIDAADLVDATAGQRFVLMLWGGRRPTIAGEKGAYFVLTRLGRTCGEVLAATWTRPLIAPLVAAIDLLERSLPSLRPAEWQGCGAVPFRAFAGRGWPLLAGGLDSRQFETTRISFDHQPDEGRFQRPGPL